MIHQRIDQISSFITTALDTHPDLDPVTILENCESEEIVFIDLSGAYDKAEISGVAACGNVKPEVITLNQIFDVSLYDRVKGDIDKHGLPVILVVCQGIALTIFNPKDDI